MQVVVLSSRTPVGGYGYLGMVRRKACSCRRVVRVLSQSTVGIVGQLMPGGFEHSIYNMGHSLGDVILISISIPIPLRYRTTYL